MMKCEVCRFKSVKVEELRHEADGPVVAIIHKCTKCDHIQKRKEVKQPE